MNRNTRNRNRHRRFASDYYYNDSSWPRDEEWYRHTYGLPATGRIGNRRRHDIAQWGNPNFAQNTSNKQHDRIDDHHTKNEVDLHNERRDYDYNRYGMGDQRGTWNQRRDESYNWGEYSNQHNSHYSSDRHIHRGKGPKGFTRSDERIKDDIACRLTDDGYVDASDIDVTVEKGEVTLSGTVSDRFSKRRAEDIAELVSGVTNVENRIRVK